MSGSAEMAWECGPHTNSWKGHDARCRKVRVKTCVHCGDFVMEVDGWWTHTHRAPDGNLYSGKSRCQSPAVAYGHLAHPAEVLCWAEGPNPCLGARTACLEHGLATHVCHALGFHDGLAGQDQ